MTQFEARAVLGLCAESASGSSLVHTEKNLKTDHHSSIHLQSASGSSLIQTECAHKRERVRVYKRVHVRVHMSVHMSVHMRVHMHVHRHMAPMRHR